MSYDEDPDFVLTGKKDAIDDANLDEDFMLSFIGLLADYNEKLDPQNSNTSLSNCIDEWLKPQKKEKLNVAPYVSIVDLNNSKEEPYKDKPKNAIEIGINVKF